MSDLAGNPNCWFSHALAHMVILEPFQRENLSPGFSDTI